MHTYVYIYIYIYIRTYIHTYIVSPDLEPRAPSLGAAGERGEPKKEIIIIIKK